MTIRRVAILFALFIVLIIVLADLGKLGIFGYFNQLPMGDKAGHFILYGILTLLIDLSLFRSLWLAILRAPGIPDVRVYVRAPRSLEY